MKLNFVASIELCNKIVNLQYYYMNEVDCSQFLLPYTGEREVMHMSVPTTHSSHIKALKYYAIQNLFYYVDVPPEFP